MSAVTTIAVDTVDAHAKTLKPIALTAVHFADNFDAETQALLIGCCVAVDEDATHLPAVEHDTDGFRPGRHVRWNTEIHGTTTPVFVVVVDDEVVGGWRGHNGNWIVGLAVGEVRCPECDDFHEASHLLCKRCANESAIADEVR